MRNAVLASGTVVLGMVASASAATISSSPFSVGFGFTTAKQWNTIDETSAVNVYPTGDFTLDASVAGSINSGTGPGFVNRDITSPGNSSGWGGDFLATLIGSYSGTPVDAAVNPNYQISLNISSITIYAVTQTGAVQTLNFTETTSSHEQTQSGQNVASGNAANGSTYTQVAWDVPDYSTAGLSQTRTFALLSEIDIGNFFFDGFEIAGTIEVTYDAVPEPASAALLLPAVGMLMRRRR